MKPLQKVSFTEGMLWWKKTVTGRIVLTETGKYSNKTLHTIAIGNGEKMVCKFKDEVKYI